VSDEQLVGPAPYFFGSLRIVDGASPIPGVRRRAFLAEGAPEWRQAWTCRFPASTGPFCASDARNFPSETLRLASSDADHFRLPWAIQTFQIPVAEAQDRGLCARSPGRRARFEASRPPADRAKP